MLNKFMEWLFPTTAQREEAIEDVFTKVEEARCEVSAKIEEIVWFHNNESRFLEDYHEIDLEVIDWGESWDTLLSVDKGLVSSTAVVYCPDTHRYYAIDRTCCMLTKEIEPISEENVYLVYPKEVTTTVYKRWEV